MDEQRMNFINDIRERRARNRRRRMRRRAAMLTALMLAATASCGFVYTASANEITLTEINEFTGQSNTTVIKTHASSVEEILDEHGMSVSEADKISVSSSEPAATEEPAQENTDGGQAGDITGDANIVVMRGKQVTVKTKDGEQVVNVTKADAKAALEEAGITVGENDEVKADGDVIELVSVTEKEEVTTEPVPFETEYVEDDTLAAGETKVSTEGREGEKTIIHKITFKDGVEVNRELVSEDITKEPVNKVVLKGTKPAATPGPTVSQASAVTGGSDTGNTIDGHSYSKKITMRATAYSTHPSENGGYTVSAMGNPLGHGIVAVDPSVIPLGSKVYVAAADGSWVYGVASAEDTGGAIKGNKIDLCYEGSVSEVNTFGVRDCVVYILD